MPTDHAPTRTQQSGNQVTTARVPTGRRIYAIGDIHGRYDLLAHMHRLIATDATHANRCDTPQNVVVYLGDYIDRGPMTRDIITALSGTAPAGRPLDGFETVYLKGNHEDLLLKFLDNYHVGRNWLPNGGAATLRSYGIETNRGKMDDATLRDMQASLHKVMPGAHKRFFNNLKLCHDEGDYYFAHAGVSPHRTLDNQQADDLLWIRDDFLSCPHSFGKVVVHGHTITPTPQIHANRIGIDTGAYATGQLTCLILQENVYSFLQTRPPSKPGDSPEP